MRTHRSTLASLRACCLGRFGICNEQPTDAGGDCLGLSIVRLRAALATWLPRGKRKVMSSVLLAILVVKNARSLQLRKY